jgi:hypothetical protein
MLLVIIPVHSCFKRTTAVLPSLEPAGLLQFRRIFII